MAGTTAKGLRFPTGGDAASDAAIATLVSDFDMEITSQDGKRGNLRYRPVGVMGSNATTTVTGPDILTKLKSEVVYLNQGSVCDTANNRFTIGAAAGAGAYFVWGSTDHAYVSATTSVQLILTKNAGTVWVAGQRRQNLTQRIQVGAIVNLVVGDNIGFYVRITQAGPMNFTRPTAYLYKLAD